MNLLQVCPVYPVVLDHYQYEPAAGLCGLLRYLFAIFSASITLSTELIVIDTIYIFLFLDFSDGDEKACL